MNASTISYKLRIPLVQKVTFPAQEGPGPGSDEWYENA